MKIGILGGGQLARMLALAGRPMGLDFLFLEPTDNASAGCLGQHLQGAYDDSDMLHQMAKQADVVTFEFENVPAASVECLAADAPTYPSAYALTVAQNRLKEKNLFRELGISTPQFVAVDSLDELESAISVTGLPAVLKTRAEGYDGKGQVVLRKTSDAADAWRYLQGAEAILEAFVPYDRELSIIAVRGREGEMAFYPVSENTHREGILHLSMSRLDDPMQKRAEKYIRQIAETLDFVGVITLELFQVGDELLANEIAPRVHNSGHWTIEGAETSQFENHLRAILGWPLGSTALLGFSAMVNFIGSLPEPTEVLAISGANFHSYAKEARPGRKIGHATIRASNEESLQAKLQQLLTLI